MLYICTLIIVMCIIFINIPIFKTYKQKTYSKKKYCSPLLSKSFLFYSGANHYNFSIENAKFYLQENNISHHQQIITLTLDHANNHFYKDLSHIDEHDDLIEKENKTNLFLSFKDYLVYEDELYIYFKNKELYGQSITVYNTEFILSEQPVHIKITQSHSNINLLAITIDKKLLLNLQSELIFLIYHNNLMQQLSISQETILKSLEKQELLITANENSPYQNIFTKNHCINNDIEKTMLYLHAKHPITGNINIFFMNKEIYKQQIQILDKVYEISDHPIQIYLQQPQTTIPFIIQDDLLMILHTELKLSIHNECNDYDLVFTPNPTGNLTQAHNSLKNLRASLPLDIENNEEILLHMNSLKYVLDPISLTIDNNKTEIELNASSQTAPIINQ